jgi:hypothetical protein
MTDSFHPTISGTSRYTDFDGKKFLETKAVQAATQQVTGARSARKVIASGWLTHWLTAYVFADR